MGKKCLIQASSLSTCWGVDEYVEEPDSPIVKRSRRRVDKIEKEEESLPSPSSQTKRRPARHTQVRSTPLKVLLLDAQQVICAQPYLDEDKSQIMGNLQC